MLQLARTPWQFATPASGGRLAPGTVVLDRFEVVGYLGEGGMATVYSAVDRLAERQVALKILKSKEAGDQELRRRFLREARTATSLNHPNVVQVHEVLEADDGAPIMVMELLEGETLGQRLNREDRLGLSVAAAILLPVLSAVAEAHQRGVVHRDLKPDNIFIALGEAACPVVKVLDFGIAKVTSVDCNVTQSLGLTSTGEVLGTPNYMSPEQVFGEKDIDRRTDVWALGIILYECLAGVAPTQASNVGQVFKLIVSGGIRPLEEFVPDLPTDVAELLARMLARERESRPESLDEVARVLTRHAAGSIPVGERQGSLERAMPVPSATPTPYRNTAPASSLLREGSVSLTRRPRVATLGAAVGGLAIAVGGAWFFAQGSAAPKPTTPTPPAVGARPLEPSGQASAPTQSAPPRAVTPVEPATSSTAAQAIRHAVAPTPRLLATRPLDSTGSPSTTSRRSVASSQGSEASATSATTPATESRIEGPRPPEPAAAPPPSPSGKLQGGVIEQPPF